ncbi:response regulator [Candidatus Sumerlaeota bacterium]|nr:response regulator [Candidatus Sumerlaeota bacterium]
MKKAEGMAIQPLEVKHYPPQDSARILIVDDHELILETLSDIIEPLGHAVDCVQTGILAIEKICQTDYDLVICDVQMPKMSGLELLEKVKVLRPGLPVVIITGYPSVNLAIEAMKKGALEFVTKPFDAELTTQVIQRAINERKLLRQNEHLLAEVNQKAVIEKLNRDLQVKINQLTQLVMINERFAAITDNDELFSEAISLTRDITDAERVSLMIYDRASGYLSIRAAIGIPEEVIRNSQVRIGEGIVGAVARERRIIHQKQGEENPLIADPINRRYYTKSFMSVPLLIGDELFGVLNLADKRDRTDFSLSERWMIEQLADKLAIRIENNLLYEGIYSNLVDTLKTLVFTLEARDSYTRQHSQRVTAFAMALAKKMGCGEEEMEQLKFSAVLHDIGKIGISDVVLLKPGRLTDAEFEIIKTHPVIGDAIVEPLGLSDMERKIIRHHHEKVNGKGYPDGLKHNEIPQLVRIASVADAFDAMTSTRPYRDPMPISRALDIMHKEAGEQFDPEVLDALDACLREGRILATEEVHTPSSVLETGRRQIIG